MLHSGNVSLYIGEQSLCVQPDAEACKKDGGKMYCWAADKLEVMEVVILNTSPFRINWKC